jgi:hypothetical protein
MYGSVQLISSLSYFPPFLINFSILISERKIDLSWCHRNWDTKCGLESLFSKRLGFNWISTPPYSKPVPIASQPSKCLRWSWHSLIPSYALWSSLKWKAYFKLRASGHEKKAPKELESILNRYFGYSKFHGKQLEAIEVVLSGLLAYCA